MRSSLYTHDVDVLGRIDKFMALNSAIEVDLTGQINAEVAEGRYIGAVGGAVDFLRGAHRSQAVDCRLSRCAHAPAVEARSSPHCPAPSARRVPMPVLSSPSTASPICAASRFASGSSA